jgi:glycolate dehydrogenase iron-sulfur subunit
VSGFAGLATCVHCGFCLQQCPTYLVTGDEADGPRGRIVLMQHLAAGTLPPDDRALQHHLDRCLGCRGCEPVCPSGVAYGPAIEAARARITAIRPLPTIAKIMLAVMARPTLRRVLFTLARLVRPVATWGAGWSRPGFVAGMLAGTRPWTRVRSRAVADQSTDEGLEPEHELQVAVFRGCVQRELFGHVNAAAERTLAVNGYAPIHVEHQGCCGALHIHAGEVEAARALARTNIRAFATHPDAAIAATAAGCGATLRDYGALLADDPLADAAAAFAARVRDVTELLAANGPRPGAPLHLRVAYDPPCHLLHAQRVADAPRTVLAAVPGITIVAHAEAEICCGSAGIYSLVQPSLSHAVLARKLAALDAAAPDLVVTGNPGCAMQIAAGLRATGHTTPVAHPVEVLDAAYLAAGLYRRAVG